ncbi:uncharacterized protein LOC110738402 [Chenopodium quinoa]|uniref:uncharacterized protein LOC110738402 n=1 Tax=Chenopodium quinoa TaxID=63459 RepID=UPI000B786D41|nr:uncharacterized protein LOC110738402 [Chenopodium quinoa]
MILENASQRVSLVGRMFFYSEASLDEEARAKRKRQRKAYHLESSSDEDDVISKHCPHQSPPSTPSNQVQNLEGLEVPDTPEHIWNTGEKRQVRYVPKETQFEPVTSLVDDTDAIQSPDSLALDDSDATQAPDNHDSDPTQTPDNYDSDATQTPDKYDSDATQNLI